MITGLVRRWERNWMKLSAVAPLRPLALRCAALFRGGYKHCTPLARLTPQPFIAPGSEIGHPDLQLGAQVFVGDSVALFSADGSGSIQIGERSALNRGVICETSVDGHIVIGRNTHIQPRCQLSAAKGSITIGDDVQIAPACGFYPYSHGMAMGLPMREQPVTSRGDIVLGDDVWLGYGAVILEGAKIGKGAVVAAGAVVRDTVPEYAIVAGVPARVVGSRLESAD